LAFPEYNKMVEPFLSFIYFNGDQNFAVRPYQTYKPLADFFDITQQERMKSRHDRRPGKEWENRVQWLRQRLINSGELDNSSAKGIWRLSQKGLERAKKVCSKYESLRKTPMPSSGLSIDVESKDFSDLEIDDLILNNKLRIGIVQTGTEAVITRQRRGQHRLRELTLLNYSSACALCDVNDPTLLVTSHIVGWAEDPETQGLLSNIICLCKFHDALFENGYLSLADDFSVLKKSDQISRIIAMLLDNTVRFRKPSEHPPKAEFLRRHRRRCGFEE